MSESQNTSEKLGKPSPPQLAEFRWEKGMKSPNPGGRPKKTPFTDIYAELLAEGVTKDDIKKALRAIIKQRSSTTVQLLKEAADRVEGKSVERVEHTGADGEPLQLSIKLVVAEKE